MTASATKTDPVIATAIQEINHIATLPEVTLRIVELVEDPSSTAQDLQRMISNDPALCSRILKVVNSAFYGLPGQVASIDRAIVLLGLNAVKNIAVAASLVKLFRGGELGQAFSARELWTHSIATATAARQIATTISLGLPDEAFLAGLMHDIGVVVELQYDRQKLLKVVEMLGVDAGGKPRRSMIDAEREVFGADHQAFGEALSRKWKFPHSLSMAAGHHHDPLSLPAEQRTLPTVVHIADLIAAESGMGFRLDLVDTKVSDEAMDAIGISAEQVEEILGNLPNALQEVRQLLS
ncbi:MAG: HDOD domain-containing protein [Phycisphaerales bacterium]|nr:HDOD domain-containing protein [Phycisphaerales bacterium]